MADLFGDNTVIRAVIVDDVSVISIAQNVLPQAGEGAVIDRVIYKFTQADISQGNMLVKTHGKNMLPSNFFVLDDKLNPVLVEIGYEGVGAIAGEIGTNSIAVPFAGFAPITGEWTLILSFN